MNYLVLVFCDTEKNNPDYQKLKQDLDDYFGFPVCGRLVFYVSPCTMLVIANHFVGEDEEPIRLTKVSKSESGKFLSQHGIDIPNPPYGAKEEQRKAIMASVTKANYRIMKSKIVSFVGPDTECPATNVLDLFEGIQFDGDGSFIEDLVRWIETQKERWDD